MKQETLKIHSENILPIIKKWLYSDKDIFVRELVSNSSDALFKRKKITNEPQVGRIDITIDKEKKTLTFSDNGIGMDAAEVEKYIAQIAFSGAEEFLKKYQTNKEEDHIIGHFGLGFYSAYMVAARVDIQTLSYKQEAEPVFWSCDGSSQYTIGQGSRQTVGTDIILTLSPEESEYLEPSRVRQILERYCRFLTFPIYLNGSQINEKAALWMKNPAECQEKEYLDFFHYLFPSEPDPLFWIHLNIDYPFNLKGILYFPKLGFEREFKKESLQLYCNRVFVSESCKDVLPDYLTILQGAIDSPDIPLNVSRSDLQRDRTVKQLGSHIAKKISDRLSALFVSEREKFISYWEDIEPIIKFGILQDDKFFGRVKDFLLWKTNKNEWTTLDDLCVRTQQKTLYYASEEDPFLDLYQEKGIEVIFVKKGLLDQAVISFLERQLNISLKRIDSAINEKLLDPSKEKNLLDKDGRSEAAKIAEFFRKKLNVENLEVEAKSFDSQKLPGLLLIKEEERRIRDSLEFRNPQADFGSFVKPTFVVNTNSPLISAISALDNTDPELAGQLAQGMYDLACLSQAHMPFTSLPQFISRSSNLLQQLALKLTKKN